MELNDIFKKLDEIDHKYSDTSKVSEKAYKDLGEQQLKFAQELAKVSAEVVALQKKELHHI